MKQRRNMKPISIPIKIILIFIISILLSLILSPIGGSLHILFWKSHGCDFWGPCDVNGYTEGFIYFYILFITLLSFSILRKKNAWIFFVISTFVFWLIIIFKILIEDLKFERAESIGTLIIMFISFVIGYVLAFLVKKIKTKTINN